MRGGGLLSRPRMGGGFGIRPNGGGVAGQVIGAPTLTRTSSAGASPVTWTVNTAGTGIYAGYYWNLQVDGNSDFSSPEQNIYQLITADEFGDLDSLIEDFVQPLGTYYLRLRAVIDDGASGPGSGTNGTWSNTLTDTIASAAVAWDSGNKSAAITLTNSDFTATNTGDDGTLNHALAEVSKTTGKWYFEVHVTNILFGGISVGLTEALPAYGVIAGQASATAITYFSNGNVYRDSGNDGGANQSSYEAAGTFVIGCAFDADAGKVWFAKANTFYGDPAAGTSGHSPSSVSPCFPFVSLTKTTQNAVLKSLSADFTYSPPAGFTALGGA